MSRESERGEREREEGRLGDRLTRVGRPSEPGSLFLLQTSEACCETDDRSMADSKTVFVIRDEGGVQTMCGEEGGGEG